MSASIKICTRRSFRNRRGVCFLKSWAAQRPRGWISEIEEAFAFSKAGLLKDHEGRSQKSKRFAFSKAGLLRDHEGRSQKSKRFAFSKAGLFRPRGSISEIEEAPTFPALSAPVTRTLSFAEIMGILSKISGEVEST
ncbi:hypothetical protein PS2_000478 [Malus domestica]